MKQPVPCTPIPPRCASRRHGDLNDRHDGTRTTKYIFCDGAPIPAGTVCDECATEICDSLNSLDMKMGVWTAEPINKGHQHPEGYLVAQPIPDITTPCD